jgi:hypothetical protein
MIGCSYVEIKEECWKAQHELLLWVLPFCTAQDADSYHQAQGAAGVEEGDCK